MEVKNLQLLHVADAVAREKSIDREEVLEAICQAIQKAGRTKYGYENDIRAEVNRDTGDVKLYRCREVVEDVENEVTQLTKAQADKLGASYEVGDVIRDELPPVDFGRVAAQTARQVIMQKVKEAERERQYMEYKNRVQEVINGVVKRIEFGNVILDLGRAEGLLRREEIIPRENFQVGDRVRAYIFEVRPDMKGHQILLSRTHPDFMRTLFVQEVPEIYEGTIQVKSVARDPGSRAKISVYTSDSTIDPVGACVGMRGSRVQAVVGELQGEKIDIVPWSEDTASFVVNALAPAEVSKVVVEDEKKLEVVVPDDQLSMALGRRGQNVRLASQLTSLTINILTETQDSERRTKDMKERSKLFIDALDVDEVMAQLLVLEGFDSVEELAESTEQELLEIEGFEESLVEELKSRADEYLKGQMEEKRKTYTDLGVQDDLVSINGLTPDHLIILGKNDIKTLDDFAELSNEELRELLGDKAPDKEKADEMILAARAHWFEEEKKPV